MDMGLRDVRREGTTRFSNIQSGSGFSEPSKKKMLKKLGLGDEKLNPCHKDLENEVSVKKSKLLNKNLKDINGVDHASVPRKLRSGFYHMERSASVSKTQFLSSWEDYAMKKRNLESVSKLFSASKRLNRSKTGMESLKKDVIKKENQEMEAKAIVPESMMISKDEKEVAETLHGLAGMFTENKTCDPLSDEKETSSKVEASLVMETDFTRFEPEVSVLSSAKTKQLDEKPLEKSDKQRSSTGMVDLLDRLKQNSSMNVADVPARPTETKSETDYKSNGLALWPGLSAAVQSGSNVLSKPSSTKLPLWMGQAVSPSKSASLLTEPLRVQPRKLNKCASHIYISRLIKVLQTSKSSPAPATLNQIEQRSLVPDPVTTTSDFKSMVTPPKRYQNQHLLDINRTHNPKTVQEGITKHALELYGPHTVQKQSYDFLSLSSSGAGQTHFPQPNSFPQYHIYAAYNSQLSPGTSSHQVHQLSPYQASRFQTTYNANQQQQLQKRLWAAQYRPQTSVNTAPSSSNQYSKPNLSLNLTCIQQPLQVASSPRYNNNVSQQQHRLMAAMSMRHHQNNPSRTVMNRQEHHFPLIYEDTRTPLQLLCNEHS